jgi:curli production assembly/transport component CsgG
VLTSVTASKTIASQSIGANAFRYVAFKELLQAELGYTTNEPDQVALQQAIEKAVYGLVMEGVDLKLWDFADREAGWPLLVEYKRERDGKLDQAAVDAAFKQAPPIAPQKIKRNKSAAADPSDTAALQRAAQAAGVRAN